ncbi:ATP-binding protein [Actinokineospora guangxiensis]|uniref:ATP-binding protein n=1 Tax=Actinokineospora guangxiensis TaxID=1490288 RepID=A0ABW0ENK0_9PSEU
MPGHILTGTPGAGKTSVLRLLETEGHPVVEEAATDVIGLHHALGAEDPWRVPSFIDDIVRLQRLRRAAAPADALHDRSPVCTLALSRYLGFPPSALLTEEVDRVLAAGLYSPTAFLVRNQGFIHNTAARRISFADSLEFERLHEQTYRDLGFHLVEVPAGALRERAAVIRRTVGPRR